MEKFQPSPDLDHQKRKAKVIEKIGSTIVSVLFVWLFWHFAENVEKPNTCYVQEGNNVPSKTPLENG